MLSKLINKNKVITYVENMLSNRVIIFSEKNIESVELKEAYYEGVMDALIEVRNMLKIEPKINQKQREMKNVR